MTHNIESNIQKENYIDNFSPLILSYYSVFKYMRYNTNYQILSFVKQYYQLGEVRSPHIGIFINNRMNYKDLINYIVYHLEKLCENYNTDKVIGYGAKLREVKTMPDNLENQPFIIKPTSVNEILNEKKVPISSLIKDSNENKPEYSKKYGEKESYLFLPLNKNYQNWIYELDTKNWKSNSHGIRFNIYYNNRTYMVEIGFTGQNSVQISIFINNKILIKTIWDEAFKDGSFKRSFKKTKNIESCLIIKKVNKEELRYEITSRSDEYQNIPTISKVPTNKSLNEDIITFDIETYLNNEGEHIPYACGYMSNNMFMPNTFYKTDYPGEDIID